MNVQGQEPLTAAMLANIPREEQKNMFGERLFPLIQNINPEMAGKITGMMLELDKSELLNVLESKELLEDRVREAVTVLQAQQATDYMGDGMNVQGQEPLTAAMLANAPKQEQKNMFGERLFPLIQKMNPNLAGKITGMMLELDNSELLYLLESKELLEDRVRDAIIVLQTQQS